MICPVSAILNYCVMRGTTPGLFVIDRDGQGITKVWFMDQLRSILADVGVPQNQYCGHSLPIGAATFAALAGVEDSTIQTLGRWPSSSMPRKQLAQIHISSPGHNRQGKTGPSDLTFICPRPCDSIYCHMVV